MPHPTNELEATAFRNFGIELQSFSFLQKLSSIVQSRFLVANQGNFLRTLISSIVIDAILDSAHVFKKIQIPDP
jgi:hypothetical protein